MDDEITYIKWGQEVRETGSSISILSSSTSWSDIDVVFKLDELGWCNFVYE